MLSRRLLRIKVVKALFAHLKSGADNMMASEKTLMASVDKAYDLYFQILTLPVELTRYAEQRQELAKQKKLPTYEDLNPNTKFVDNQVIRVIANSDAVNDHIAARKLGWGRHPELIRTLYTQLSESDYFKDYMLREERSFADDRKLLGTDYIHIGSRQAQCIDTARLQASDDILIHQPAIHHCYHFQRFGISDTTAIHHFAFNPQLGGELRS